MNLGDSTGARPEEDEDEVVQDLEDGYEAAAHRQAQDTAHVCHKPGIEQLIIPNCLIQSWNLCYLFLNSKIGFELNDFIYHY